VEIPFAEMVRVLGENGIEFDWDEKDNETPRRAWNTWAGLPRQIQSEIAQNILAKHSEEVRALVIGAIESEEAPVANVERIELLLKTSEQEYHLKKFTSVKDTLHYLTDFTTDVDNVKGRFK